MCVCHSRFGWLAGTHYQLLWATTKAATPPLATVDQREGGRERGKDNRRSSGTALTHLSHSNPNACHLVAPALAECKRQLTIIKYIYKESNHTQWRILSFLSYFAPVLLRLVERALDNIRRRSLFLCALRTALRSFKALSRQRWRCSTLCQVGAVFAFLFSKPYRCHSLNVWPSLWDKLAQLASDARK